ncbi:FAD binding domain-containing protein [Pseudomassariella vexata]|uniref:FAD binding domain-containing protein n=1 Tax=Pseudomassariella vexata TaxID=1141098 RepID=A0A1Y2DVM1_9PEZI|nr:FAD binding domain-containing protein [Pseudomassariella vexata]ORY63303.1 FAD binding domain-containing protein [Pseudomassariella vexata]
MSSYDQNSAEYNDYNKLSIKHELKKRLSTKSNILLAGEDNFAEISARYTEYKRPLYIAAVQVQEEQDVIETVNYARSRGIPFAARAGGHSLTGSLRRIRNAIEIDMRGLNTISYDANKQQMTVGGGVTTGEFANATHAKGMEVTVGSCPCTGVMGISLGAGIGRLQGKYGYLNDNMVHTRLLLANGTVLEVSDSSNPDLFWAIRGAGHNFGIVLEATYQVYPQLNDGRHFVVDFEFELDKLEAVFEVVNSISDPMPKEVAVFVIGRRRGANGKPTININVVYSGPESEAEPFVKPFDAISPVWKDSKTAAWDALPWATYNGLNNILCTPAGWARFPIKNFYAANVAKYDIPTMRSFFDGWRAMNEKYEGTVTFSVMFESFPQQRVREIADDNTAYPWRHGSQHFLLHIRAQSMKRLQTSGCRTNRTSSSKPRVTEDSNTLYGYEPWRLEKLRRLKKEYDPEGFFNGYQPLVEESELEH